MHAGHDGVDGGDVDVRQALNQGRYIEYGPCVYGSGQTNYKLYCEWFDGWKKFLIDNGYAVDVPEMSKDTRLSMHSSSDTTKIVYSPRSLSIF